MRLVATIYEPHRFDVFIIVELDRARADPIR